MGTTGLVTFNGLGVRSVFQLDIVFLHEDGLLQVVIFTYRVSIKVLTHFDV